MPSCTICLKCIYQPKTPPFSKAKWLLCQKCSDDQGRPIIVHYDRKETSLPNECPYKFEHAVAEAVETKHE